VSETYLAELASDPTGTRAAAILVAIEDLQFELEIGPALAPGIDGSIYTFTFGAPANEDDVEITFAIIFWKDPERRDLLILTVYRSHVVADGQEADLGGRQLELRTLQWARVAVRHYLNDVAKGSAPVSVLGADDETGAGA
jgi:hypothetical protein